MNSFWNLQSQIDMINAENEIKFKQLLSKYFADLIEWEFASCFSTINTGTIVGSPWDTIHVGPIWDDALYNNVLESIPISTSFLGISFEYFINTSYVTIQSHHKTTEKISAWESAHNLHVKVGKVSQIILERGPQLFEDLQSFFIYDCQAEILLHLQNQQNKKI